MFYWQEGGEKVGGEGRERAMDGERETKAAEARGMESRGRSERETRGKGDNWEQRDEM